MKRTLLLALACSVLVACDARKEPTPEAVAPAEAVVADSGGQARGVNFTLVGRQSIVVPLVTAVSQTDVNAFSFKPGYAFKVLGVQVYARTEAGVVTADVKIGTVSALSAAAAFATATRSDVTLTTSGTARLGGAASIINVHYTSDATGALTNGFAIVTIGPS